ncbi:S26 family signal peptidase [Bradyrhizobium sp. Cp5.3]|uniref:S26 family signal peptidase n=1 Tax=Bradyrhizobium sp. Cp5.3 TaxID=443598 RepID=UPI0035294B2E
MVRWECGRLISEGQLFRMNRQSSDSLDPRYFGILLASAVIGRAFPVWSWED